MSQIEYRTDMAGVTASMIEGLFVGWPDPPDGDQLVAVMAGSHRRVWAVHEGCVVGYIAAISDGVLNAFIPWLEVHPDHQHHGVGGELVRRLVAQLDDMYAVDLLCDDHLVPWYESLGFMPCSGAALRRPAAIAAGRRRPPAPVPAQSRPDTTPALRPLRRDEAAAVLDAFTAPAPSGEPDNGMSRQGDVVDLASAQRYVDWLLEAGNLAAVVAQGERIAALVGVRVDADNRSGWFFYWTHPACRGAGLASRAAATVADWALTTGGLERLELGYRANNPGSARVAEAAGFVVEGRERGKFLIEGRRVDAVTAARLATDPAPVTPLLAWESTPSAR